MELKELARYSIEYQAAGNFMCESSNDGKIACLTDSELVVLRYKPEMENELVGFKFDELYVQLSDYHIADQTGIDVGSLMLNIPRNQFYKLLMNEIFTPELENTNPHVTKAVSASWSPKGAFRRGDSALAVVTNTGNVEIFIGKNFDWECIANLTKKLVSIHQDKWVEENLERGDESEVCLLHEKRVLECAATCMSWSSIYKRTAYEKFLFIIVGYLNGDIAIWQIKGSDHILLKFEEIEGDKIDNELVLKFKVFQNRQTAIHWCPINENSGWIVCGDLDGYVKAILVSFSNTLEIVEQIDICTEPDIQVSKITSINLKTKCCFLIIKGAYIILALLDNITKKILWTDFVDFGNLFISGVQNIGPNYFMVLSYNGIMQTLEIKILGDKCEYKVGDLKTDIDWTIHSARGILKLPNGYLWGVLVYPCKFFDHLDIRRPTEVIMCTTASLDPGKILKENDTLHLEDCWELLDIIRVSAVKQNKMPCSWLTKCEIFEDISIYELRIWYWISVASSRIIDFLPKNEKHTMSIPEPEELETLFGFKYRLERLKYLVNEFDNKGQLTEHQLNSLYMLKFYLREIQEDDTIKTYYTGKYLDEANKEIDNADKIENLPVPDCILCEIPCVDGSCSENHPFERCLISHVQITFEAKWKCPYCEGFAHDDIEDEEPYCPFCDIPLVDYDLFAD